MIDVDIRVKIFISMFFSGLILYHSNETELILGLVKLKVPYEIGFMIQLATLFLLVFMGEMKDTIYVIQLRGFKKQPVRTYYGQIYFKRKDYIIMNIFLMMTVLFVYNGR
ncbi:hypothetical protein [Marinisporobacter balticus]|uniref:Uncharacterized protein n=1 Tax=Marinisporobacter balticus TaxID=2018667 RepID=A0A4V2SBA8_9FIRM|nr:hypothetical protein [Marinisporobacter balticus]TCO74780.1 hypothetical protein EV214_11142 [Marinisporobacter balticus]